ncbi:hypothetical protein cyc_04046 [Cyclospora cayetanensis]|uniref:Uncharacterized protein n=1 Tax=Cyclospora cayetanensis TaxID=88456 RepID=A0A1D3D5X2_9EIME|nr:hypothetical protein cyc_04046 [Cyclospora cayetanensis]
MGVPRERGQGTPALVADAGAVEGFATFGKISGSMFSRFRLPLEWRQCGNSSAVVHALGLDEEAYPCCSSPLISGPLRDMCEEGGNSSESRLRAL